MDVEFFNYRRLINSDSQRNIFKLPWASMLIRNLDRGKCKFVKYETFDKFKKKRTPKWVKCTLKIFRQHRTLFHIYVCGECKKMKNVSSLGMEQNKSRLRKFRCIHSRMCEDFTDDWRTAWPISLNNIDHLQDHSIDVNSDIVTVTLLEDTEFLAVVKQKRKPESILHTVTSTMRTPWCTVCKRRNFCKCVQFYKQIKRDEHRQACPNGDQVNKNMKLTGDYCERLVIIARDG